MYLATWAPWPSTYVEMVQMDSMWFQWVRQVEIRRAHWLPPPASSLVSNDYGLPGFPEVFRSMPHATDLFKMLHEGTGVQGGVVTSLAFGGLCGDLVCHAFV